MNTLPQKAFFTRSEERWNSCSHAVGIAMGSVMGAIFLTWSVGSHNSWATLSVILYLFGMMGSYLASVVYHATSAGSVWKERFRKWDHSAIYWHIAGSYSPITLLPLREQGYWGWSLFVFVWLCAAVGTVYSFRKLKKHSNLETLCYIGMGLCVLLAFKPLLATVSTTTVLWIVAEGVCYITGAIFYSLHKQKYMHTVFHFFVLAGSACHMVAVWHILVAYCPVRYF